jgi:hypothetical protein
VEQTLIAPDMLDFPPHLFNRNIKTGALNSDTLGQDQYCNYGTSGFPRNDIFPAHAADACPGQTGQILQTLRILPATCHAGSSHQ